MASERNDRSGAGRQGDVSGAGGREPGGGDAREELPNLAVRALQVFGAPGRLFRRLRDRPAWMGALGLMIALTLLASVLVPDELVREAALAQAGGEADPEEIDRMMRTWMPVFRYGGSLVGPVLQTVVVAAFVVLIYNLALGGEASFRQAYAVTCHALLIAAVGSLLTVPLIVASGDLETALSLHLLVPGLEEGSVLFNALRGMNVFGLWSGVVLGVGVSEIYPSRSARGAAGLLVGTYAAIKAISAAVAGFAAG